MRTQELVVPRSIPITLDIMLSSYYSEKIFNSLACGLPEPGTVKFLEVYDNLERAVGQAGDEENVHKKGMEMIFPPPKAWCGCPRRWR